jgi:hypothetical protein
VGRSPVGKQLQKFLPRSAAAVLLPAAARRRATAAAASSAAAAAAAGAAAASPRRAVAPRAYSGGGSYGAYPMGGPTGSWPPQEGQPYIGSEALEYSGPDLAPAAPPPARARRRVSPGAVLLSAAAALAAALAAVHVATAHPGALAAVAERLVWCRHVPAAICAQFQHIAAEASQLHLPGASLPGTLASGAAAAAGALSAAAAAAVHWHPLAAACAGALAAWCLRGLDVRGQVQKARCVCSGAGGAIKDCRWAADRAPPEQHAARCASRRGPPRTPTAFCPLPPAPVPTTA